MLKPLLVLCLGNEILGDDGFGHEVARRLSEDSSLPIRADILFAAIAGWRLLDLMTGRERVLIVDTIKTGHAATGTLHKFSAAHLAATNHLCGSHQISLPEVLKLGASLQLPMPHTVDILAVEAGDVETFGEHLSPPVSAAVNHAVEIITRWISDGLSARLDHEELQRVRICAREG